MRRTGIYGTVLATLALAGTASAQGFPTTTVRISPPATKNAIRVENLTQDTFFLIDATPGFAGFILPACNTLSEPRSFGATKVDGTSNPIRFLMVSSDPNASMAGAFLVNLKLMGENITLGCDTLSPDWFVMSGEFQKGEYKVHRTPQSSTYPVYKLAESDRYATVRYVANTAPGKVMLSDLPWVKAGYAKTFTVRVERTANSEYPVEVCAPPGRSLDNVPGGCVTLTEPREIVDIDFDSAEFMVTSHYPAGELVAQPTAYPELQ